MLMLCSTDSAPQFTPSWQLFFMTCLDLVPCAQALDKCFDQQVDVCKAMRDCSFDTAALHKVGSAATCLLCESLQTWFVCSQRSATGHERTGHERLSGLGRGATPGETPIEPPVAGRCPVTVPLSTCGVQAIVAPVHSNTSSTRTSVSPAPPHCTGLHHMLSGRSRGHLTCMPDARAHTAQVLAEHFYHEGRMDAGDVFVTEAGVPGGALLHQRYAALHGVMRQVCEGWQGGG